MYGLVKNKAYPLFYCFLLLKEHVWFGCPCMIIEGGGVTLYSEIIVRGEPPTYYKD